jgi:demethylmenaquinone methyltransferase/2-methoxy-6-polyprenyl-1,4-benzoquinol methylase
VKAYYQRRAPEYDQWYLGTGRYALLERPGWNAELASLIETLSSMPAARTLDVACGTGFLTRHLPGRVTGLDQSPAMLGLTRQRIPDATLVEGDAIPLPFADDAFERLFTGHFYGHLESGEREDFVEEARRVAAELVVVDSAAREGVELEATQQRILNDGSVHTVYKRYFEPEQLADELGGGDVLHAGRWFVAVRSPRP